MKRFKKIYIEITDACNLHCQFCNHVHRKNQFLALDRFQTIMEKIIPFTDHVYLHVLGEPLLHPDLREILSICQAFQCKVNIVTNGIPIALNQEIIRTSHAIRQINFSLHCLEESHTKYPMEKYLQDILNFSHSILNETSIIVSYRLWNLNKEYPNPSEISKKIILAIQESFAFEGNLEEAIIWGKGIKIKENLYLNTDYKFVWPDMQDTFQKHTGFCYGLRDQIAVLLNGTVIPCCLDSEGIINLGNIYTQSLASILESDRVKNIYQGFSERKAVEKLCIHCRYKSRFD